MSTQADAHLIETTTSSEPILQGRFLKAQRDHVRLPTGESDTREYVLHGGAVVIVPLLDDGRAVLERQWRHPLAQVLLEFPAGKIDPGEATATTAARELHEETGYVAREWAYAGQMHNAAAYSTERIEVWFARGLTAGAQQLDHGEFIEIVQLSMEELDAMAASGALTDAKTLIGLLWWQKWRAGVWALDWRAQSPMIQA